MTDWQLVLLQTVKRALLMITTEIDRILQSYKAQGKG